MGGRASVPEPSALVLALIASVGVVMGTQSRRYRGRWAEFWETTGGLPAARPSVL
jgi:hypothetical protein